MTYSISFDPYDITVDITSGETVIDAARKAGIPMANVCGEQGKCGRCRVRVISGSACKPGGSEILELG